MLRMIAGGITVVLVRRWVMMAVGMRLDSLMLVTGNA